MKRILLVFILISLLFVSSCKKIDDPNPIEDTKSIDEVTEEENNTLEMETEEDFIKLFPSEKKVKLGEKGQSLNGVLKKDFETGKITREERALYTLMLAYNQEDDLPETYQGNSGWIDTHYELRYIRDHWEDFSKTEQDKILPLILPVDDPRSIHYPKDEKENSSILPIAHASSEPERLVKRSFIIDGRTIEIAYVLEDKWIEVDDKYEKLEDVGIINELDLAVEEAIRKGWSKFKPLMGKTLSSDVRVELIAMREGLHGEEKYDGNQYRIRLNSLYLFEPKSVQSTTVHELFHAFQDEYNIGYSMKEEKWLAEATAVWSENHVYPKYNMEHICLPGFFETLSRDRINYGDLFEYDSYMLFYYLTEYADMNFIREIIEKAGASGNAAIRPYLNNKIPNRREVYAEFALLNWNQEPTKVYYDDGFLEGTPNGDALISELMFYNSEDQQSVSLKPGAIKYYHYDFDREDEALHHVNIDFSNTFPNDSDVSRQALIKINGEWYSESWYSETKKRYCNVGNDDELVEEVILIYSNGSFTDTKNNVDYFKIWTGGCHEAMTLDIIATYNYSVEDFNWSAESKMREKLLIQDHYMFLVKNSDYSINGKGIFEGEYAINTNGQISGSINEPSVYDSMVRIVLPMGEEHEEILEIYRSFGIEEITPQGGVLVTLPFAMNENNVKGSMTIEFPEPVGIVQEDFPLLMDGVSQAIAIEINPFDWGPEGLSFTKEINLLTHKPAILDIYKLKPLKMKESLKMMEVDLGGAGLNIPQEELDEMNEMLEDLPEIEGMDMPGLESSGSMEGTFEVINSLIGAMSLDKSNVDINATLTIEVKCKYIED